MFFYTMTKDFLFWLIYHGVLFAWQVLPCLILFGQFWSVGRRAGPADRSKIVSVSSKAQRQEASPFLSSVVVAWYCPFSLAWVLQELQQQQQQQQKKMTMMRMTRIRPMVV